MVKYYNYNDYMDKRKSELDIGYEQVEIERITKVRPTRKWLLLRIADHILNRKEHDDSSYITVQYNEDEMRRIMEAAADTIIEEDGNITLDDN